MTEETPPQPPPAPAPGEPGSQPPSFPPPNVPPPAYGIPTNQPPTYQPPNADYAPYGYPAGYVVPPQRPEIMSARALVLLVVGIAIALVVAGAVIASLLIGRTTKLSHQSVEQFIAQTYNADVVCNNGHDMPIAAGRTYECVGNSLTYAVNLLDDSGTYQVEAGVPQVPTADASL